MVQMAICEIQYMKVRWLDHLKLWQQLPNSILSATSDTLPPTVINAAAASLNIYQCLHHFNRSQTDLELSSVHLFHQSSTSVKGGKSLESDFASTKVLPKCKKPPVSALICNLFARHRLASLFSLELPTWCLPSSRQWLPIARGELLVLKYSCRQEVEQSSHTKATTAQAALWSAWLVGLPLSRFMSRLSHTCSV